MLDDDPPSAADVRNGDSGYAMAAPTASPEEQIAELKTELHNLTQAVNVINHLAVSLDISAAMDSVRNVALQLLNCDRVTLFLVFDRHRQLRSQVHDQNDPQHSGMKVKVKFGEGIAGTVAQTGELMNIHDAYKHPLFNPIVDKRTGYYTKSVLCCAIRDMSGKSVAVLQALNKKDGQVFTPRDERNLRLFGTHLGNALAKAKLHEQAKREKARLSTLFNYFKLLSTASNLSQVMDTASAALHRVLHAEHAFLFIMDTPRGELWMQCRLQDQEDMLSLRVRVGDGLVGRCGVEGSSPINLVEYTNDDPLISNVLGPMISKQAVRSLLVQPVFRNDSSGKVIAVVLAVNKKEVGSETDIFFEDYFTEADVDAMALFALEVGDVLASRGLEVAYASALSIAQSKNIDSLRSSSMQISSYGLPRTSDVGSTLPSHRSTADSSGGEAPRKGAMEDNSWSQIVNLYSQSTEQDSLSSQNEASNKLKSTSSTSSLRHWQSALKKLTAVRTLTDKQRQSRRASQHASRLSRQSMLLPDGTTESEADLQYSSDRDLYRSGTGNTSGGDNDLRNNSSVLDSPFMSFASAPDADHPGTNSPLNIPERRHCSFSNAPSQVTEVSFRDGNQMFCTTSMDLSKRTFSLETSMMLPPIQLHTRAAESDNCLLASLVPKSSWHRSCNSPLAPLVMRRRASTGNSPDSPSACFYGRKALASWDYNFTDANAEQMIKICYDIFILSGVVDHFRLNITTLGNFLAVVASQYHDVPYHNLNHAVHVLHGTWMALQCPTAQRILTWEDRLALMLAALVHDLDHDGHSNSFHQHTQSNLARLYNDRSIMENHHCALAFEILRRKDCALLESLDKEVVMRLRKTIVNAILCTDMSNHFSMTQDFCKHSPEFDPASEADRLMLCKVILHSADIGSAVRPFHINEALSKRVQKEFHLLAQEETELGIPVTLSVDCNNPITCAQIELRFLDYIVWPLWERLAVVIPELEPALCTLKHNRELYSALAEPVLADV